MIELKSIVLNNFKNKKRKENSYKMFLEKYDAQKNYSKFIEDIVKIGIK